MIFWIALAFGLAIGAAGIALVANAKSGPQCSLGGVLFVIAFVLICLAASINKAFAQEHRHRPQDADLRDKFYRTWMMPDNRTISCCHNEDCRPAQAYEKDGKWYARQDGDDKPYTVIPPHKVEQDRDSPDGRSHLCGRRYFFSGEFTVFCFLPAGGT